MCESFILTSQVSQSVKAKKVPKSGKQFGGGGGGQQQKGLEKNYVSVLTFEYVEGQSELVDVFSGGLP